MRNKVDARNPDPSPAAQQAEMVRITEAGKIYHCGVYSFLMRDSKLVVMTPRVDTPNDPQHHYDLLNLPINQWFQLKDSKGNMLSIYINWSRMALQVRTGTPPQSHIKVLPVSNYSRESQFEAQLNGIHKHPEGGFWLRYYNSYPHYDGSLMVRAEVAGEAFDYPLGTLPNRKWVTLSHPSGEMFPLKVYRDQKRVWAEWLPLDGPIQQDASAQLNTNSRSTVGINKGDIAKGVGAVAVIGLGVFAHWLAKKSEQK